MKSFQSTVRVESQLPGWDGVAFTVRKQTEGLKITLRENLAAAMEKIREAVAEAESLEVQAATDPIAAAKLRILADSVSRLQANSIDRAHVMGGLVSIEGLEIDGKPATPALLIESGPPELYAEVRAAVRHEAGLSEQERKNSESPITSAVAGDGQTSAMIAADASSRATT